jgi:secreted Zn-dependent insulinase-like peptidase
VLEQLQNMTYDDFARIKAQWLTSLELTWLIQGHITMQDALALVRTAESSLKFERIAEEDVLLKRCVWLKEKTVY